jgi:hypothetical protein
MTCPNHRPVPCRQLDYQMVEDTTYGLRGHMTRAINPANHQQIVVGHTDGLGCPACGSFMPVGLYVPREPR